MPAPTLEEQIGGQGDEGEQPPREGDYHDQEFGGGAQDGERCLPAALGDAERILFEMKARMDVKYGVAYA